MSEGRRRRVSQDMMEYDFPKDANPVKTMSNQLGECKMEANNMIPPKEQALVDISAKEIKQNVFKKKLKKFPTIRNATQQGTAK